MYISRVTLITTCKLCVESTFKEKKVQNKTKLQGTIYFYCFFRCIYSQYGTMTKDMSFLALDKLIIFKILQKLQAHSQGSLLPVPVKQERERPWLGLVTCYAAKCNINPKCNNFGGKCNNFLMQSETIFLTRNVTRKMLQP